MTINHDKNLNAFLTALAAPVFGAASAWRIARRCYLRGDDSTGFFWGGLAAKAYSLGTAAEREFILDAELAE